MTRRGRAFSILFITAFLVVALSALWPAGALAQCPLCRTALQNGGEQTARTINSAILVLLIPPVAIFCSIFGVAYRKIKKDDKEGE
jgi:hypothetical protein